MEEFFQALGMFGLVILIVIGVLAGIIASEVQGGRHRARNIVIGVVGALLMPFLVTLLFAGMLAAGGLLLLLVFAVIGAVIVLAVARTISR